MSYVPHVLATLGWDDRVGALIADFPAQLVVGRVIRIDRGRATVATEVGELRPRLREPLAVGDWVGVDVASDFVAAAAPRRSALTRRAAGGETLAQTLAANVDLVLVAQALHRPVNIRRLERELVVAWESGASPIVLLTKADLCAEPEAEIAAARTAAAGLDVIAVSVVTGQGLSDLRERLGAGRTFVVIGSSGVGKSTLVNVLVGEEVQDTGGIRLNDGRGRHTTTAAQLIPLPGGSILIDTPGLREVALWEGDEGMAQVFADIDELAAACRFRDCQHEAEPGCAVRGGVDAARIEGWRRLGRELVRSAGDRAGWEKAAAHRALRALARSRRDQPYRS